MNTGYRPPYTATAGTVRLVAEICEALGRIASSTAAERALLLNRENRIRTVHASLAIENNTLSLDQVTAILDGKRILGPPREILEVRNAFRAYDRMEHWDPASVDDLLDAHRLLMDGLVDDPGAFRRGSVGIARGQRVLHVAPPAERVPGLVGELLDWLRPTDEHPLVAGAAVHYELEFIHPFSDGNGRTGRLWQTVVLRRWRPVMAGLPVETLIHDRREDYYRVLARADGQGDATPFIEFMLEALLEAVSEVEATDQATDRVTDQVRRLLQALGEREMSRAELMDRLGLSHGPTFRKNYLSPALSAGWVARTEPESPRSPTQRYRRTGAGRRLLDRIRSEAAG